MIDPRPAEDEYLDWIRVKFGVDITEEDENYYLNTADSLAAQFRASIFWRSALAALRDRDQRHKIETTYALLAHSNLDEPEIQPKPFASLVLKSYRRNVLDNTQWPDPPPSGWVLPDTWLQQVSDIVRTSIVVKYLDGVEIVCELLSEIALANGIMRDVEYQASDDGYYAAHSTVRVPLKITSKSWQSVTEPIAVEIQVTTQVQEVIKALTHKFYEQRRRRVRDPARQWQWSYRSDEFVPNYLGHILHYVEGMIMEVREKQERNSA